MGLPFSLPSYIKNPTRAFRNSLEIQTRIGTECLGGMLVDDAHYLEGHEASSSFFLIPVDSLLQVDYGYGSFIADCISFEHMVPCLAIPIRGILKPASIPWLLKPPKRRDIPDLYLNDMIEGLEVATKLSFGLWQHVRFRYDSVDAPTVSHNGHELVHIPYTVRYEKVRQALHLYNSALRQPDPLTQFLNFYRTIESLTSDNGTSWVKRALGSVLEYKTEVFAQPWSGVRLSYIDRRVRRKLRMRRLRKKTQDYNLMEILRAQALLQIETLRTGMTDSQIVSRLYRTNRCGIAHGRLIRRHDISIDFLEVLADLPLISYFARLAIEEQI